MRIIHTADWHIGQELLGFSRRYEQECFLNWLIEQCRQHRPDALLIAGDVFHHANPSSEALELFSCFTERALAVLPSLLIVAVAGNHDSPARFDALVPIVRTGVRLIGSVPRHADRFDLERLLVKAGDGVILAMPYLKIGDLHVDGADEGLQNRVAALHRDVWKASAPERRELPCVFTGHLHVLGAEVSDSERPILVGGEDSISAECFPAEATYVALGHLHLAQQVDGGRVRYSGSPIPLTAKERSYKHEIVLLDIARDGSRTATSIVVPRSVQHLLVPSKDGVEPERALELIESTLNELGIPKDLPFERQPFVEVSLSLSSPQPKAAADLREAIQRAEIPVRLVHVGTNQQHHVSGEPGVTYQGLDGHSPQTLFPLAFANTHGVSPEPHHTTAFNSALMEAIQ